MVQGSDDKCYHCERPAVIHASDSSAIDCYMCGNFYAEFFTHIASYLPGLKERYRFQPHTEWTEWFDYKDL